MEVRHGGAPIGARGWEYVLALNSKTAKHPQGLRAASAFRKLFRNDKVSQGLKAGNIIQQIISKIAKYPRGQGWEHFRFFKHNKIHRTYFVLCLIVTLYNIKLMHVAQVNFSELFPNMPNTTYGIMTDDGLKINLCICCKD